ncbi:hypothetical protein HDU91_007349, partial [Kappamyces sp. JEL0680]
MIRNFKRIRRSLNPDVVIFVGDLMDGGREWKDDQFNTELLRFNKIFKMKKDTVTLGVAGNHDIGFGETSTATDGANQPVVPRAHARYMETFGALNSWTEVANHSIIALDTIGLSGPSTDAYKTASRFLDALASEDLGPSSRRILLSHVPLYRPEGSDCGPRRRFQPIRNMYGYQYQSNQPMLTTDMIQPPIASRILETIRPDLVISGDDHDDCVFRHSHR